MNSAAEAMRPTDKNGNPIYRIPEVNLEALDARVEKMNRRARRLKMEPLVLATLGEEFEERSRKDGDTGKWEKYHIRLVLVTLTGTCPVVNGWRMAATIQHGEDGNILRTVPGFETTLPAHFRTADRYCEHCKQDRRRNDTYVLVSAPQCCAYHRDSPGWDACSEDLEGQCDIAAWKQIGRNCLADFLRTADASGLAEYAEMLADIEDSVGEYEDENFGGGGRREEVYATLRLLTQVACCVRADGWCSRGEARNSFEGKQATVDTALWCFDRKWFEKQAAATREKLTPTNNDELKAAEAILWAQGLPADVTNDYLWNIRLVSNREYLGRREAGLAGSIIAAYNRHLEREMKRKYANDHVSACVGTVKVREVFTLTVMATREMQGDFGLTTLVSFRDAEGNRLKWFCSGATVLEVDKEYRVKATVKEHQVYKGQCETMLSRVAVEVDKPVVEKKRRSKVAACTT